MTSVSRKCTHPAVSPAHPPDTAPFQAWTRADSLKIRTAGHPLSVSTPTLSPLIPLKPPDTEGMFGAPHPDSWGPEGGLFTISYTLLPQPGAIWVSAWFKPKKWRLKLTSGGVYCVWLQGRGAWVYRDTPVSLYWASPDCMNGQTDWRPWSFELYSVWLWACTCFLVLGEQENIL